MRDQLNTVVTGGVLCVAIVAVLVSSLEGTQQVRRTLIKQGERIASGLAKQSVLALLYDSSENAAPAVAAAASFPDVVSIEIHRATAPSLLLRYPVNGTALTSDIPAPDLTLPEARFEAESEVGWQFVAPVIVAANQDSPFIASPTNSTHDHNMLGYVRVVQSKEALSRAVTDIVIANVLSLFLFSLLYLWAIAYVTRRITRPFFELSTAMRAAERGEHHVTARVSGPRDIAEMATAFNRMIGALQDRDAEKEVLLERLRHLVAHIEVVTEEQNRQIAQDLHDLLGGNLAMLKLGLASLFEETAPDTDFHERLSSLCDLAQRTIGITKDVTATLYPTTLDTFGLDPTIQGYVEKYSRLARIECTLDLHTTSHLSPERATAVFRIFQEAMTNIARHSMATHVVITTGEERGELVMRISDNGKGYQPDDIAGKQSLGFIGMRMRTEYLGGALKISTAPGTGTIIEIRLPIRFTLNPLPNGAQ